MWKEKKEKKQGFTILEVLISGVILAIGISALLLSIGNSYQLYDASSLRSRGTLALEAVIEELKGYKDFDQLYNDFKDLSGNSSNNPNLNPSKFLYVKEDGSIDWSRPASIPADAIGYGWLEFVVYEKNYDASFWGTDTATSPGEIDLNGDGDTDDTVTVGRTSGSPIGGNYYHFLPVKIYLRIGNRGAWNGSTTGRIYAFETGIWITSNGEK